MTVDTIYAPATPAGGGIAIIRVSGPKAGETMRKLTGKKLPRMRTVRLFTFRDPETGVKIDQGVVLFFRGPASYTGEDMVEYQVHGGRSVIESLLNAIGGMEGCRLAEPGEFTRRAFENDRMDLTEAEAVADLIAAETEAQRLQALSQLGGSLYRLYDGWTERLKKALAHQEADIEFPDEDMPDGVSSSIMPEIKALILEINDHLGDNRRGERLRNGISIAIFGAPNVGKSSLVNALAQRDVAIVSDTAGTTRDVIEVHLDLGGYPVTVADTAGLREADSDMIEAEGIRRARMRASEADLKIAMFDAQNYPEIDEETASLVDEDTIVVFNKTDLSEPEAAIVRGRDAVHISVKTEKGLRALLERITEEVKSRFAAGGDAPVLTRERHRAALQDCADALTRALETDMPELTAEDIRLAMRALGRITGRVDVEDLLDVIFRDFCIGK